MKNNYKEFNHFVSLQDYRNAFEKFKKENNHYPTTTDIDNSLYLPSSKTIQRKFGSLLKLRKLIGLPEGELDHRTGDQRAAALHRFNNQSYIDDVRVYDLLVEKYGEVNVHRQSPYFTNKLHRSDFKIFQDKKEPFFIDIFYPANLRNLTSCLNLKQSKIEKINVTEPVYFVVMNSDITQPQIDTLLSRKKNPLPLNIKVFAFDNFVI